ncbi:MULTISPECIES: FAD assembly factor SdhE [Methylocaldum]|jgi:antitoxin CptB|uniref:FAD assembly factor SdhE n=1 Tax=unclassified Methylocaldum TaxID=2622260 RepID=UPI001B57E977|nr:MULTISPECIES: succinate dehydrogenase assembly factor 2 [unclassified Methylocaldum]MBP1151097.1 antitoxin CptB [Methylocaldum sp. RMAD-M]
MGRAVVLFTLSEPMKAAQLRWRCRRGMRELDLLLQRYLDSAYDQAPETEKSTFIRLLDEPDERLWRYLYTDCVPIDSSLAELVLKIRSASPSSS